MIAKFDTMDSDSSLADFLSAVPPALTVALVHLARPIYLARSSLQLLSWSSFSSWLALALWWAICLFIDITLRRFLPFVLLVVLFFLQWAQKRNDAPTTEHALRTVITDLTIIQSLLPQLPSFSIPLQTALRVAFILYVPYLLLSSFVSFHVVVALLGTVIFTWRAPWAVVLRATVWRSAWLRWTVYKTWAALTGTQLPPPSISEQPSANSLTPVQSLRFLFTLYENQRWWMGLDWTAALLPGERPSWCSASQHPLSPPNAFTLPENTTVYLSDGKGHRLKRTATWKWEEPEWRVVIHKDGGNFNRVERPLPSLKEEVPNSSRLFKAADRLRSTATSVSDTRFISPNPDVDPILQDPNEISDEDPLTDTDGWVYGDNKWEAQSSRGGMGKYTRYRRWTRVAIVFEVVEIVSEGALGIQKGDSVVPSTVVTETTAQAPVPETIIGEAPDSPLKQRLKNALNKNPE